MSHLKLKTALSIAATIALLSACTQGQPTAEPVSNEPGEKVSVSVSASADSDRPAPFDGDVTIAVVRQLNAGDVYENWIAGVQRQADDLGIELDIYNADGDDAKQALFLDQAIASKPDGILIGWGFVESLAPGLEKAAEEGIPVATYYIETPPSDSLITIDQGDDVMMQGILDVMVGDVGDEADVIYVYVPGYQALDLRNTVWESFASENPGINNVATIGVVNSNTAAEVADQAKAALTANPTVTAIVAPYDEFAKGATLAVEELGLQDTVKVYGMDISTADIAVMTAPNSPWVVTATTDQSNVGAAALRVLALKIAGQLEGNHLTVPPLIVTQAELLETGILNVEGLGESFPDLMTPDVARAPWMD